jgi:outer membrane immunogenic protein
MKKLLLGSVAAAALMVGPAVAADMRAPVRKAPPVAAPAYSWTGCYIGVQGGWQWGRDHTAEYVTATGVFNNFDERFDSDGFVGGGHIGCTYQAGVWVWGIEGDFEGATIDGGYTLSPSLDGTNFELQWQGSIRGRLGWAVDRTLFYVTGGLAFASLEYTYVDGGTVFESFKDTQAGWTIGAGIEHAFAGNWTARVEYRFTDYGSVSNNSLVAFPGFTYRHDPEFHAVRGYLTYRFGGPVVARY